MKPRRIPPKKRRLGPSKKGQKLALWRTVIHGRVHSENGKKCQVCIESEHWGHRCCWECNRFHLCFPKWAHDYISSEETRFCPYAVEKFKHCSKAYDKYKEMLKRG